MARVTVSIDLPARVAEVWQDVERLETHAEWMADAESIDFASDQRRGVGVVMRVLTKVGVLRTTDVIRVVVWEPPHRIGVIHEGLVTGIGEFRLEPVDGGTTFTWDEDLQFPWFMGGRLGGAVAAPILRWVWRRNLRQLALRFD